MACLRVTRKRGTGHMSESADAVIIGAGVHGASLAFHLAERGMRPLVVERATVAAGATGRSSGVVRMHYDVEADARLAWLSHSYFTNWAERVGGESGFVRTGFLQMVPGDEIEALRANVAMQQELGIETDLVDAVTVAELVPGIRTDDIELAAWEPRSGYADPTMSCSSLLAGATARGARIWQHTAVSAIRVDGERVLGVETSRGPVDAPIVVLAAGAWSAPLGAGVGLELPIQTWRHDVAYLHRPPELPTHPTLIDFANSMYARPEGEHLTLVALEDGNPLGGSPDEPVDSAAPGFIERAAERLVRRLPAMEVAGLHSAHSGVDGLTPDQHPLIGAAGPEGLWLDCGYSGTGFKIAPAVGAALAELITEGEARFADLRPYRPQRFAEGAPVTSPHPYAPIWR